MSVYTLGFGIIYPFVALLLVRPLAGHIAWTWRTSNPGEFRRLSRS